MSSEYDAQFKELKADIREGFKSVNERIDGLVTRNELKAELRRIDEKHEQYAADTLRKFEDRDKVAEDRDKALDGRIESFTLTTRWAIGVAVSAAAIIVSIINFAMKG